MLGCAKRSSTGEFQPGQHLTELSVAALFGISRTPVREAFFRLARDGLVRNTRGWGDRSGRPAGGADRHLSHP